MALSIKVDTPEIPSILKMFGLGGNLPDTPPVDPSIAGASDPTASPDSATPEPASAPASTHDETKPPTKLLRLQQALGADQQAPPLQVPGPMGVPEAPMPPADLAGSLAAGTAKIKPTFREAHPNIFKTLGAISQFAEDAGPGVGAPTFGQGFSIAANQETQKKKEELEQATGKANLAHTQAATKQLESQVTLPNGLTVPFALAQKLYPTELAEMGKDKRNQANIDSRESLAGDKNAISLRKQGLKLDANGKQVPLGRDEMSETEQAHLDLQQSQQEAASAKAAVDRAKNDPNSPAYKAAIGRLQVAQKNAATAAGRLGLAKDTFNANYFGTGPTGEALPGATTDEKTGLPVGPRMANAAKIPADRLKRGDLASNAISNLDDIVGMIHSNPELFGSLSGRITTAREMMGSDEPAIREIAIAAHNYALASAGVHGTRSQGAVEKTENELLNHWKDGDTAVLGGIAQAKKSLQQFVDNQQLGNKAIPKRGGGAQAAAPPNASAEVYAADGKTLIGHAVNGKYVPLQKQK